MIQCVTIPFNAEMNPETAVNTHITMILLAFQQFRSFTHWVSALRDRLHGSGGVVGDHCEIPVPVGNGAPEPTRLVIAREP